MRIRTFLWSSVRIFQQQIPRNWYKRNAKILHDQDWGESILQSLSHKGSASVKNKCELLSGVGSRWCVVLNCWAVGAKYVC